MTRQQSMDLAQSAFEAQMAALVAADPVRGFLDGLTHLRDLNVELVTLLLQRLARNPSPRQQKRDAGTVRRLARSIRALESSIARIQRHEVKDDH